jgi:hypothetical protein
MRLEPEIVAVERDGRPVEIPAVSKFFVATLGKGLFWMMKSDDVAQPFKERPARPVLPPPEGPPPPPCALRPPPLPPPSHPPPNRTRLRPTINSRPGD